MKKKKKSSCSCIPQQDVCNDSLLNTCKPNNTCKPVNSCKKSVKKYIEPICNDCEVKFVDTCADLASKAEELFEKALEHQCIAEETLEQAKECEESAKVLAADAQNLMKKAKNAEKESKAAKCKAEQLLEKSENLCQEAKCLYKQAEETQAQAQEN